MVENQNARTFEEVLFTGLDDVELLVNSMFNPIFIQDQSMGGEFSPEYSYSVRTCIMRYGYLGYHA